MPAARYRRQSAQWVPWRFGAYPLVVAAGRENLVPGVDRPDALGNTGPFSVNTWTDVNPTGSNYHIDITQPGIYYGRRFWGQIRVAQGLPDWSVTFDECQFLGRDPNQYTAADPGFVRAYGARPSKIQILNSRLNPLPWLTERGRAAFDPYSMGIHGGNVHMKYTELVNIQDTWNWIGPNDANFMSWVTGQSHLSQQNWYHKGVYKNNINPPGDGAVHSDGIQTNFGRNLTSRGDFIGGQRNMTGYLTWPGGSNTGDDFFNAAFMLKQEGGSGYNPAVHEITNVVIEDGWIGGGTFGINHARVPERDASWAGSAIRRMKFLPRPSSSNWGTTLYADPQTNPVPTNNPYIAGPGAGGYIVRPLEYSGIYSNNTLLDGTPVPITRG